MSNGCRVCGCQILVECQRVAVCVGVEHCSVLELVGCVRRRLVGCATKACRVCDEGL